jgi:phage shock protein PspC (stress-responsive transcriptional regulator)
MTTSTTGTEPEIQPRARQLTRSVNDRMLAGVAAGAATFLGIDVMIVRIILVVLTFVGGAAVPIYLACWLLIPEEGSDQSIAGAFIQSLQTRY